MKFEDLIFEEHYLGSGIQSKHTFDNGYSISIIGGGKPPLSKNTKSTLYGFYGDGVDTFEIAVFDKNNEFITEFFNDDGSDDVRGWLSKDEITEIMKKVENK